MRKRHLTVGWTWRVNDDGDPPMWGIYGHVPDEEARACVEAYEGEPVGNLRFERDCCRNVPCRGGRACGSGDCPGSHLEPGTGRGASPYTWAIRVDP